MKKSENTKSAALKKKKSAVSAKVASKKSSSAKMSAVKAKPEAKAKPKQSSEQSVAPAANVMGEVQHHDILQMIMDDHKPLKRLINVLKNLDLSLSARRSAFSEFAPLLTIHAKAEENTLYTHIKKQSQEMRTEGFEGDVEHFLADLMVNDMKQTIEKDIWSAKAKVLAELVEHHIDEEEDEMFPDIKKNVEMMDLIRLGEDYLAEKEKIKMDVLHPAVQRRDVSQTVRH